MSSDLRGQQQTLPPSHSPSTSPSRWGPTNQRSHTPKDGNRSRTWQTHYQGTVWGARIDAIIALHYCTALRYPGATTEEIKRAYKLSVNLHPDKNAHHKEKVEGLFKLIVKAKHGVLDTEARRRHDADIQRGDRRQQREVRHCNRGAATHDPGRKGHM